MSCLAGGVNWTLENVRLFVCRGQPPQQLLAVLQPAPTELLSPSVYCRGLVFTARRHASKALAIVRCLSVFYVSVASRHRIETVERIKMVWFWRGGFVRPTPHCFKGNSGISKIRALSSGTLSPSLDSENSAETRRSLQLVVNLARQRWTISVTNWTVVGRSKLTLPAFNRRPSPINHTRRHHDHYHHLQISNAPITI